MVCLSHPPLARIAPGPEGGSSGELKNDEMTLWDVRALLHDTPRGMLGL